MTPPPALKRSSLQVWARIGSIWPALQKNQPLVLAGYQKEICLQLKNENFTSSEKKTLTKFLELIIFHMFNN